jgi:ribosomal protein S13
VRRLFANASKLRKLKAGAALGVAGGVLTAVNTAVMLYGMFKGDDPTPAQEESIKKVLKELDIDEDAKLEDLTDDQLSSLMEAVADKADAPEMYEAMMMTLSEHKRDKRHKGHSVAQELEEVTEAGEEINLERSLAAFARLNGFTVARSVEVLRDLRVLIGASAEEIETVAEHLRIAQSVM